MRKVIGFLGATLGGAVGWWLGVRFGTMTAFILSTIASGFGLYYANRWAKEYLP
jgi:hypothetical protein